MTYAYAARVALSLNAAAFEQREVALPGQPPMPAPPAVIRSQWLEQQRRSRFE